LDLPRTPSSLSGFPLKGQTQTGTLVGVGGQRCQFARFRIHPIGAGIATYDRLPPTAVTEPSLNAEPGCIKVVDTFRKCSLDGYCRIDRLTATLSTRRSVPCCDGIFGKPNRQLSPPRQRGIIVGPIRHSVSRPGEFVTASLIELVWQGLPKSKHGTTGPSYRPGDSATIRPAGFRSLSTPTDSQP
jgi:hypothetical protein